MFFFVVLIWGIENINSDEENNNNKAKQSCGLNFTVDLKQIILFLFCAYIKIQGHQKKPKLY